MLLPTLSAWPFFSSLIFLLVFLSSQPINASSSASTSHNELPLHSTHLSPPQAHKKVIYEIDDRMEFFQAPPDMQSLVSRSIMARILKSNLKRASDDLGMFEFTDSVPTVGKRFQLCEGEGGSLSEYIRALICKYLNFV
jgi:hypothetical protein